MFKILLVTLFFFQSSLCSRDILTKEVEEWYSKIHKICVDQTGVDEQLVADAERGQFPDNAELKKFFVCLFEHEGVINDDGSANSDKLIATIPEEIKHIFEIPMTECKYLLEGQVFDTVLKLAECIFQKESERFFVP